MSPFCYALMNLWYVLNLLIGYHFFIIFLTFLHIIAFDALLILKHIGN